MSPSGYPIAPAAPTVVIVNNNRGPNIVVRLLWFVCLGLWLGSIATFIGYALCLTIIGLPFGLALLNRLPAIMTLRPMSGKVRVSTAGGATTIDTGAGARQLPFVVRALYFACIGSWLTGIWLTLAWSLALLWWLPPGLLMLGAFWMFDRVPAVLTLRRN